MMLRRCSWLLKWIWLIPVLVIVAYIYAPHCRKPHSKVREIDSPKPLEDWQYTAVVQETITSSAPQIHYYSLPSLHQKQMEMPLREDNYGEDGQQVQLINLSPEQQGSMRQGWSLYGFNLLVSDFISLHRRLPDKREKGCLNRKYSPDLPNASIVIAFHNEANSTLLRTVHSIIDKTPQKLLNEIILVDDFSSLPHLKQPLAEYLVHLPIVRLIRTSKREGLVRARLLGVNESKAPVLVFMDSHCECIVGWLEPLLQAILNNWTKIVSPVIDVIDEVTFEYKWLSEVRAGGFNWNMQFEWHDVPESELKRRKNKFDPIQTPIIPGIFAVNQLFFQRLGTFDKELNFWGGENLEVSFKAWMCGGSLEILPCSHVGHLSRSSDPLVYDAMQLERNGVRIAEVWMDDYKNYYFQTISRGIVEIGDISDRIELRKSLHCKSFHWYLTYIYPELFVPGDSVAFGEIRHLANGGTSCIDSNEVNRTYSNSIILKPCHGRGGSQYWMMTELGAIRIIDKCLEFNKSVFLAECRDSNAAQLWLYDSSTYSIQHRSSGLCLESSGSEKPIAMATCNRQLSEQQWQFEHEDTNPYRRPKRN